MNIKDLTYIVSVAKNKHFGKAAAECFVSQPTLSMQIKKIETELSISIFERSRKKVLVTQTGQRIVDKARAILADIDTIKSIASQAQHPDGGHVRLGVIPTISPYLTPNILHNAAIHHSDLSIAIFEDKTEKLIDKLLHGELDLLLMALPIADLSQHPIDTMMLFTEPFKLLVPRQHPLAQHQSIALTALKGEPLLLLTDGHCLRDQALAACQFPGAQLNHHVQASSLETLHNLVAHGQGVTLLPKMMTDTLPDDTQTVQIHIDPPTPSRQIGMAWRKGSPQHAMADLIATLVQSNKTA